MCCCGPSRYACAVALVAVTSQGCAGRHHIEGRGAIDSTALGRIEVGTTTREEVILRFGEPSGVFEDESVLFYQWSFEDYVFVVVVGYGGGGAGEVSAGQKSCFVLLAFDDEGVLERRDRTCSAPRTYDPIPLRLVEEFASPGRPPPNGKTRPRFILTPALDRPTAANTTLSEVPSLRVKIADVTDDREESPGQLIGQRKALGVATHDIYLAPGLRTLVRELISVSWEASGHAVVRDDPDVTVIAHIKDCRIQTPGVVFWSAVATIEITIETYLEDRASEAVTGHYRSRKAKKTTLGPSEEHLEEVMSSCLQDVMRQMICDEDVTRHLQQLHSPN